MKLIEARKRSDFESDLHKMDSPLQFWFESWLTPDEYFLDASEAFCPSDSSICLYRSSDNDVDSCLVFDERLILHFENEKPLKRLFLLLREVFDK